MVETYITYIYMCCQAFQGEQLSKAEKGFTRMANSPPPPGLEDKVKEVNERFQRVVKQTKDRCVRTYVRM